MSVVPDRTIRLLLVIIAVAMGLYVLGWNPAVRPTAEDAPTTAAGLQAQVTMLEAELSTTYVQLTQRYLAQGNLVQAKTTAQAGLRHFPTNLDLLRLQADLETQY